nr:hypothetical protein [Planctomycetales bacterium]
FSHRAGKNVDSFFVSGRTLTWYVAGASMIATSFAADTPLWVGSLVRQYGVHAVWQYWAPLIGSALGVVLFARMWRRTEIVTDVELVELRYSGAAAGALRGISAAVGALVLCPLIIGWVAKAMVTISQEAFGLGVDPVHIAGYALSPETVKMLATLVVMLCALLLCAFSGLYGVVYTDFVQFLIATGGAFLLAWLSVQHVGGLESMVEKLADAQVVMYDAGTDVGEEKNWSGQGMNLAPEVSMEVRPGGQSGSMSIWNVIGYFGILWWGVALSGGYQAQRILACKDTRHASNALLMHTIIYYAVVSLPWVVVGLASLLVFPDMGKAGHDAAYPRMILTILPVGLCGIMIAAMIAAFVSTMSTLFNWGSSYIVNDLYRRFLHPGASDKHYVRVSRIVTFLVAVTGGIISFYAEDIQQLLGIFYVVGGGAAVVGATRWLWWRINAPGELTAFVINWVVATLMLFGHKIFGFSEPLLDPLLGPLLGLAEDVSFTNDYDTLGARMLFMTIVGLVAVVVASLATPPTDLERLKEFVLRTRIFEPGWRPVTRQIPGYVTAHPVSTVLIDWALVVATVGSLLFALNNVVRYEPATSAALFAAFLALLTIVLIRTRRECPVDDD